MVSDIPRIALAREPNQVSMHTGAEKDQRVLEKAVDPHSHTYTARDLDRKADFIIIRCSPSRSNDIPIVP